MNSSTRNTKTSRSRNNHYAIVIGGSLADLLTARVLADHFSHVTIIERDLFTADPHPRPGVPKSRHIHALSPRGLRIVEGLFPRIRHELEAAGAVPLDIGNDVAWLTPEGWAIKFRFRNRSLVFYSRPAGSHGSLPHQPIAQRKHRSWARSHRPAPRALQENFRRSYLSA